MKFCMHCGSSKISYNTPEGDNRPRHNCRQCGFIYYCNPRVIAGCLIEKNGKILLAKRAIEPRKGKWNLPAGFLEEKEDVISGAVREVLEETGLKVAISHLHCMYSVPHVSQVFVIFKAEILERVSDDIQETLEVRFFTPEEIPWDKIAFSSNVFALDKYLNNDSQSKRVHIGSKK